MAMPRRVFFVDSFHDPVLNVPDVSETKHRLFFLLYLSLAMVMLSLLSVVTLIPLWIQEIRHLETAGGHEIASVLKQTEVAWSSLLQMQSDTPTISWARLRRQTNDDFYYNGDSDPYRKESVVSASYKVKNYYQAEPTCCCPDLASNPGLIDTLPVSSACPKGPRGPPGQRGPIGEPGMSGLPGRPGFSSADGNGGEFFEHPYDQIFISQQQQMIPPRICEPCPYGPPGQPGGKGRPGPTGPRGVPGSPGKHGHHGYPGSVGPTGDMGPRGRPGQPGLPGAEGLPGFKRAVGRPGAKGNRGDSGAQGIRGPTGQRGTPGNPGTMGRPGPPGIRGQRGLDGVDGAMGGTGRPGTDGFYCQCPPRSIAVERPAYALAERKIVHMPTTQPPENYARNVYSYSQDAKPEAYGIPLATTRHFGRASPPLPTPPPIYHTADEYDENGFMGKDTFLKTVQRPSISYSMDFVDETRDRKSA